MQTGQAQGLPLQGRHRCTSVGATLVVARPMSPVSKTQYKGTYQSQGQSLRLPPSFRSDKGTTVRRRVSKAGAIFPSACVRSGTAFCPHPLCPPLPLCGRGGGRTAVRPYTPLPLVGEGLGVRAKKRTHSACSEPKRCTLTSSCRFPPASRGEPRWFGSPCSQGEPQGGVVSNVPLRDTPLSRGERGAAERGAGRKEVSICGWEGG